MLNWPRVHRGRYWGRGGGYASGDLNNSGQGCKHGTRCCGVKCDIHTAITVKNSSSVDPKEV